MTQEVRITMTKDEAIDLLAAIEASRIEVPEVEQQLLDAIYESDRIENDVQAISRMLGWEGKP